jgi:hypothetical protein
MSEEFECQSCKRTATVNEGESAPECCGKKMHQKTKEICIQPTSAEHSRPMEDEEPCDDFRSGK